MGSRDEDIVEATTQQATRLLPILSEHYM